MESEISHNGDARPIHEKENSMYPLATVPTSVTLSAEQFEKLYLTPMTRQQPRLAKQVGNPTPLWVFNLANLRVSPKHKRERSVANCLTINGRALGGFVITTTPLSCCLMGWRGASGNGIAYTQGNDPNGYQNCCYIDQKTRTAGQQSFSVDFCWWLLVSLSLHLGIHFLVLYSVPLVSFPRISCSSVPY